MLSTIRQWWLRKSYRAGKVVTNFIARDIRRDVEVIDDSRILEGVLIVRTRTWNVLYHLKNIQQKPEFGEPREVAINALWDWSGESWGGPVPQTADDPK